MSDMAFVITLLGAESTGKTTLALGLAEALASRGLRVAQVTEYLREFCDREARTPRIDEQRGIAAEQTRRIADAAERHDIVIADTSALMIAVYSDQVFGDTSLYDEALAAHARSDLTLLTQIIAEAGIARRQHRDQRFGDDGRRFRLMGMEGRHHRRAAGRLHHAELGQVID